MLLPREELEKLGVIDPSIAEFQDKNPRAQSGIEDMVARREAGAQWENDMNAGGNQSGVDEFYHDIPMRDGYTSSLKVHKPINGGGGPLIALAFGGGFVIGTNNQLTSRARSLVRLFGATVVNISYRLGPEYKFPYGQLDAWDSMKWIAENASGSLLGADPKKGFLSDRDRCQCTRRVARSNAQSVGGVSAGGSLSAALSRKFQEEPLAHPLTGQWLCIPSIMDTQCVPAEYKQYYLSTDEDFPRGPLTKQARASIRQHTEPDTTSELRFAVNSKTPESGQPRTYFQVDGMDPLRDDALVYDEILKRAGVETRLDVYPGCPHGHFGTYIGLEITRRANIDTLVGFGWLLRQDVSRSRVAEELGL